MYLDGASPKHNHLSPHGCARVRAGMAAMAAVGFTLCRCPMTRRGGFSSAIPALRWVVPTDTSRGQSARNVETVADADSRLNRPSYRPILASLALARQLRCRSRSRVGGLYGP